MLSQQAVSSLRCQLQVVHTAAHNNHEPNVPSLALLTTRLLRHRCWQEEEALEVLEQWSTSGDPQRRIATQAFGEGLIQLSYPLVLKLRQQPTVLGTPSNEWAERWDIDD